MPRGIYALSVHNLFSQYRGPRILNEEGAPPPAATPPAPTKDGEGTNPPPAAPTPPKPDDHEGRITDLDNKNMDLKKKLKEYEDADKKRLEDEAKARGDHEKLAEQYKNESAAEKAAREAAEAKIAVYEKLATEQIAVSIKAIGDKEKQKTVTDMLEGKPVEEQVAMLPKLLALVGAQATTFGGPTPTSTTLPNQTDLSVKKARHAELIKKTVENTISGPERGELHRIGIELSAEFQKEQEAKKAK